MKLIKEGIAKNIPDNQVAKFKASGWAELKAKPAKEPKKKAEKE